MSWIDIAAAISAQRYSSCSVVTASIDALNFIKPVYTGWIVNLVACVNYVGKTSMEVGVRVEGENSILQKNFHMASAYLTFVALDQKGNPVAVPDLLVESSEEKRRYEAAIERRKSRLALDHKLRN